MSEPRRGRRHGINTEQRSNGKEERKKEEKKKEEKKEDWT
jgi:hypothetical protein